MAISLKNHEDRIIALENRNYTKMEVIYSTSPGNSTPLSGVLSKSLSNFDFIYVDTLITPNFWPRLGTSAYLLNCKTLQACDHVTFGNDDDAVSRYAIADTQFYHLESDKEYYFRVYKLSLIHI